MCDTEADSQTERADLGPPGRRDWECAASRWKLLHTGRVNNEVLFNVLG